MVNAGDDSTGSEWGVEEQVAELGAEFEAGGFGRPPISGFRD